MPLSTTYAAQLNGYLFGKHAFAVPDDLYVFFHFCTHLSADAAVSDGSISVDDPVSNGVTIVIAPDTVDEETFTVTGVSGAGPYVLTLDGTLANIQLTGVEVAFDPGADGENILEPADTYARQLVDNATTFPSAAVSEASAVQATFATPGVTWGRASHGGLSDDPTGTTGNMIGYGPLTTRRVLDITTPTPSVPAGNMIALITNT